MIKVGIIGATGYAGAEIVRILTSHPEAQIVWYGSKSYVDQRFADVYRNFFDVVEDKCLDDNIEKMASMVDVVFTATPQGYLSGILTPEILSKVKVIDLSADYRIKDVDIYEKWYGIKHGSPDLISESVYGLCEINRADIAGARLLANPGCYTTTSILTAYPLVKKGYIDPDTLIIDAKSGVSGAGRGAKVANLYCEVNESMKPYGVTTHRHTPEIEEQLGYAAGHPITVTFTPHLAPMNRGILATEYASLVETTLPDGSKGYPTSDMLRSAYEECYRDEYFISLLPDGQFPETRWVEGSNFVDIGFKIDERTHRVVMAGALDNLVKGAAGQAVQNMNIMFGLDEKVGLNLKAAAF